MSYFDDTEISVPATGARLSVRRVLVSLIVLIALVGLTSVVAPPPAQATTASACPEMTDSIRRIYLAYFGREPNAYEAHSWTNKYMNGDMNLPQIAGELVHSREFANLWGSRTSAEFVTLMYQRTSRPDPAAETLHHWTRVLNTGYTRGEMTLALTESEHYVQLTNTSIPLSGYLRWYPPGTHWYCGSGPRSAVSVRPLTGQVLLVDRLVRNEGAGASQFEIATIEGGFQNAVLGSGVLPGRSADYMWAGVLSGDGFYGSALQIIAPETTRWAVVFYPRTIGRNRLGWQIDS